MYGKLLITRLFWHLAIFRTIFCCWLMNIFLKHFWTEKLLIHKPQHRPIHSAFIRLENLRGLSYTLLKLGPFRPLKYFKAPSITKAHKIYARLLAHLSEILFYFWTSYWYWKQLITNPKSWPWQQISNQYWCIVYTLPWFVDLGAAHLIISLPFTSGCMRSSELTQQSEHNASILVGNLLPWSWLWVGDQLPWQPLWVDDLLPWKPNWVGDQFPWSRRWVGNLITKSHKFVI